MNFKRIIFASIVIWIIGSILIILTCGNFFSWVYKLPPNIWLPPEVFQKPVNMAMSNLIGLLKAFSFSLVYAIIYKGIPGEKTAKGIYYGILIWLVSALTGLVGMPFYMSISPVVVIYWIIQALVFNIIFGIILSIIYKEK